jgi:hypothetical protein
MTTSSRQYIRCRFKSHDARTYTYHNDGAHVQVGDRVYIRTKDGIKIVTVASIAKEAPTAFATKPIEGLATPEKAE